MALYFFNILDGEARTLDKEGSEHLDIDSARMEAVESLRDVSIEAIKCGGGIGGLSIEIADGLGAVLGVLQSKELFGRTTRAGSPGAPSR